MVLISGSILNADGSPYTGSVEFLLSDIGIDDNNLYVPTVISVASSGTFIVDLWPNTRSLQSTYYRCDLDNGASFNISIPDANESYDLSEVILIDPSSIEPGILQRLSMLEDSVNPNIGIRVSSLESYVDIDNGRLPGIAIEGTYPNTIAGSALKVNNKLVLGDGLLGGYFRGDAEVTVSVDNTVIRSSDVRLTNSRDWSAPLVPLSIALAGTDNTRYAWSALRVKQSIESWFNTYGSTGGITSVNSKTGPHVTINKADVGLSNVPNIDTSDAANILSGKISPNRLSFGSTAGFITEGNDSRLSDSREWIAPTAPSEAVNQPENSTRYAWTPQRVWEAILAWFSNITSDDIPEGSDNLYYQDDLVSNNPHVVANTAKVSAALSVTTHNDVTSAGSGQIISSVERGKLAGIESNAQVNSVASVNSKTGLVVLNKADIGLSNVPNLDATNADNISSGTLDGSRLTYGNTAGTPTQGNDPRLSDSREWIANTVTLAEAQLGTSSTRRAWTSQRVRDNISFYTQPFTTTEKSKLAGLDASNYLPVGGIAVNSQLLDSIDSTQFLRSDVADTSEQRILFTGSQSTAIGVGTGGLGGLEVRSTGSTSAAMLAFHRSGAYAAYLGIDTDNQFKVGGWSMGTNSYRLWHEGNLIPSVNASNNTIVQRHSGGQVYANYFNTTPNTVSSGVTQVCVETGNDGFIRHGNPTAIREFIGATDISTPSTPVLRSSAGDINARLFRSEYDITNASIGFIMTQTDTESNNYLRPSTPGQLAAVLANQFGPGSGLDADLWDGWQRGSYLNQDVRDSANVSFNSLTTNDTYIYHGATQMGDIGAQDTTWLRINQNTAKDIYTPRKLRADGGFDCIGGVLSFGNNVGQLINLFATLYGIGIQSNTAYIRTGNNFALFKGGVHSDTALDAGTGGVRVFDYQGASDEFNFNSYVNFNANGLKISGASPTLHFDDTASGRSFWFHNNGNIFYLLSDRDANGSWDAPYPAYWNDTTQKAYFWNSVVLTNNTGIRKDIEDTVDVWTRWGDSVGIRLGADADYRIFHSGSNAFNDNYTGNTYYRSYSHGSTHSFQGEDSGGVNRALCNMYPDAGVNLYYQGSQRLATTANGVDVGGAGHINGAAFFGDLIRLANASIAYIDLTNDTATSLRTARISATGGTAATYSGRLNLESGTIKLYCADSGSNSRVFFQGNQATKMFALNTFGNDYFYIQQYNESTEALDGSIIRFGTSEVRHYVPLVNGSSRHIKDILGNIPDGLSMVNRLNPVRYSYKGNSNVEVGLVAEEVPPESHLVYGQGPEMAVDYTKLSIYLIDAVQQLTKRVTELENYVKNNNR